MPIADCKYKEAPRLSVQKCIVTCPPPASGSIERALGLSCARRTGQQQAEQCFPLRSQFTTSSLEAPTRREINCRGIARTRRRRTGPSTLSRVTTERDFSNRDGVSFRNDAREKANVFNRGAAVIDQRRDQFLHNQRVYVYLCGSAQRSKERREPKRFYAILGDFARRDRFARISVDSSCSISRRNNGLSFATRTILARIVCLSRSLFLSLSLARCSHKAAPVSIFIKTSHFDK